MKHLKKDDVCTIAGIDEVGYGAWAGPVMAAIVVLWPHKMTHALHEILKNVRDSKKMTARQREKIFLQLQPFFNCGITWSFGASSPQEVDEINVLQATFRTYQRAIDGLTDSCEHVWIDGRHTPPLSISCTSIIRGDATCLPISIASVLAKVQRDAYMQRLHYDFPGYHWNTNKGYGTAQHLEGIQRHGLTVHHRHSYRPFQNLKFL